MLVERREHRMKPGTVEQALALVKETMSFPKCPQAKCVYRSRIGPGDTVTIEWEWESLAQYEKAWAEFSATPGWASFLKKWTPIAEELKTEIWTVVPM